MARSPPPPYEAHHNNRRVTVREYRAYEEAVTRQQQARPGSGPPSYQTATRDENQAPVDRFNRPPPNSTTNSIDAPRGDERTHPVDITTPPQVAQPGYSQHTYDETYHYRDYNQWVHEARVRASQERYFALIRAQGRDPCLQQTAVQGQDRQPGEAMEVSGHLARLQLDNRRGNERQ